MRKIIVPQEAIRRHEETLGKALLVYLEYLSKGKVLTWGKKNQYQEYQAVTPCGRRYWEWVYEEFKGKNILTASPMVLIRFAKENDQRIRHVGLHCRNKDLRCDIDKVTEALFSYGSLRYGKVLTKADIDNNGKVKIRWSKAKKNIANWNGWSFAEYFRLLDIRYCPYCNAETVGLVKRKDAKKGKNDSYSAIDHIMPKDIYPLLALSLYNLVPACYKCNSLFKGDKDLFDIEHWLPNKPLLGLHPYVHNIHKWFRFKYEPTSVESMFVREGDKSSPLLVERQNPLSVKIKEHSEEYSNRVKGYLNVFELQNSYRDLYAKEINEILTGEMICTREFVADMKTRYGLTEKDFDLVFRRTSLDPREINQHRFAKLTIDLVKQFRQDISRRQIISTWKKLWRQRKRNVEGTGGTDTGTEDPVAPVD